MAAAKRLGLRVLLTRGSMNLSQRDGGLPPDSVVQDEDTILADSERVVMRYHEDGEAAMVQIALAPCSPFSVTTSLMKSTAALADRLRVRLHTHLADEEEDRTARMFITAVRSIIWRIAAGSVIGSGSLTAFTSTTARSNVWRALERRSRIVRTAIRRLLPEPVRFARWSSRRTRRHRRRRLRFE